MPNSMRRIMHRLETRITLKNYDNSITERIAAIREPIQRKFDKLHDAKVRYGSRPNTNAVSSNRTQSHGSDRRVISQSIRLRSMFGP